MARKKSVCADKPNPNANGSLRRLHVYFSGTVQGVGFRYTAQAVAGRHNVSGWVRNLSDGRVEMVAEGEEPELEKLLQAIGDAMAGYIERIERTWAPATREFSAFEIQRTV